VKKFFSILIVTSLALAMTLTSVGPEVSAKESTSASNISVLTLKDTNEHKVFKLSNGDTIEQFDKDGEKYTLVKEGEKKYKIYEEDNSMVMEDLDTNTVKTVIEEVSATEYNLNSSSEDRIGDFGTNAVIVDPGTGSKYKYVRTRYLSMDVVGNSITLVASLIAAKLGGPITGGITAIASFALSQNLPKLYWAEKRYEYREGIYKYTKWIHNFYKYHDYTGFIRTTIQYDKHRVGIY
jgi:hypothetical protein